MSSNQVVHALYDDDDILLNAVKEVRNKHYHIEEIYTPFPVHGLEKAMGLEDTRIAIASFMYGCFGFSVALVLTYYIMIVDWPQDIGGKPSQSYLSNLPAFIPVIFELTVFFAAHLMVITFYLRSRIWPFKKAENPNSQTTDDKFLMEVELKNNKEEMISFLNSTGAIDVTVIEKSSEV